MEDKLQIDQIWRNVNLPVVVFEPSFGSLRQIYQNKAADSLSRAGGPLTESMRQKERDELSEASSWRERDDAPMFCHIGEATYSAVLFRWNSLYVCVLYDMSRFYRDIERKLEEAILASRAKTNFLSEMSHDIRTPMNAIMGMTEIALAQTDTPAGIRAYLEKIRTASHHMMSLLNEVLDMSRIESGKIVLQPEPSEIGDLLHEILIVARPQADEKQLHFRLEIGRIDRECVVVDGLRFKQICINLLSNAIKFTPARGEVTMRLEIVKEEGAETGGERTAENVRLKLQVEDTGVGMSPEFLNRIFLPFEREQRSTVSKIPGTGLGMTITKNLVELMGGKIRVESEKDRGTRFFAEIPLTAGETNTDEYREALKGKRLLLLDGQKESAQTFLAAAGRLGVQTDWARTAQEAVTYINEAAFSEWEYFAFLTMETVEGVDMMAFLPEIRKRMGEDFPMLLLSENDWKQTEYMFTRLGVDAFVPLPLFYSRLSESLFAFTAEGKRYREDRPWQQYRFEGRKILLAEDNELNREIAEELLGMSGVAIETAEDGQQAVEKFSESPFFYYDLILMDIQMPVMDGLEATRVIRRMDRPDASEIPIVAMTANAFVEDVKMSMDAGMDAHVPKPLDVDLVLSCMERLLGRSRRG